jgi:putative modified peptide
VHRHIEQLIGRLVTDEDFRRAFVRDPRQALKEAEHRGMALSSIEISALLATDFRLWDRIAHELDSRLQKASLKVEA